jgi:hypothetical protein
MIASEDEFIDCFNSFAQVNKISLKIDSPNSFLGNHEADSLLNELRDETKAKHTSIEISSDEGINGQGFVRQFKPLLEYVVRGGGKWSMNGVNSGSTKTVTKNSFNKIGPINLTINFNVNQNGIENAEELAAKISKTNSYEEEDE